MRLQIDLSASVDLTNDDTYNSGVYTGEIIYRSNTTKPLFTTTGIQISFTDLVGTPTTDKIECYYSIEDADIWTKLFAWEIPASPDPNDAAGFNKIITARALKFTYTKVAITSGTANIDLVWKEE